MNTEDFEILKTIYDEVAEVTPGIYALKLRDKLGLVDKLRGTSVDTVYKQAIYNKNYAYFYDGETNSDKIVFLLNGNSLILHKTKESNTEGDIIQHSSFGYNIVEARLESEDSQNLAIINAITGEIIAVYNKLSDISFRLQNNEIIIAFEKDKEYFGVSKDLKFDKVDNLLLGIYKEVEKESKGNRVGYKCKTFDDNLVKLNKYGQIY